jgi:hypothetical protein
MNSVTSVGTHRDTLLILCAGAVSIPADVHENT